MTYLLFVNGNFFDSTRNCDLAFAWWKDWLEMGHEAGLKFVRDQDEEALKWLVPPEYIEKKKIQA
tara:strand:+ start:676 stop:870 length:195 start_codon:yes stop_codon:yes gene_type:complete